MFEPQDRHAFQVQPILYNYQPLSQSTYSESEDPHLPGLWKRPRTSQTSGHDACTSPPPQTQPSASFPSGQHLPHKPHDKQDSPLKHQVWKKEELQEGKLVPLVGFKRQRGKNNKKAEPKDPEDPKAALPTSKYHGVTWYKASNRWQARLCTERKQMHLGYYKNEDDAARAYDVAVVQHPSLKAALLNFPEEAAAIAARLAAAAEAGGGGSEGLTTPRPGTHGLPHPVTPSSSTPSSVPGAGGQAQPQFPLLSPLPALADARAYTYRLSPVLNGQQQLQQPGSQKQPVQEGCQQQQGPQNQPVQEGWQQQQQQGPQKQSAQDGRQQQQEAQKQPAQEGWQQQAAQKGSSLDGWQYQQLPQGKQVHPMPQGQQLQQPMPGGEQHHQPASPGWQLQQAGQPSHLHRTSLQQSQQTEYTHQSQQEAQPQPQLQGWQQQPPGSSSTYTTVSHSSQQQQQQQLGQKRASGSSGEGGGVWDSQWRAPPPAPQDFRQVLQHTSQVSQVLAVQPLPPIVLLPEAAVQPAAWNPSPPGQAPTIVVPAAQFPLQLPPAALIQGPAAAAPHAITQSMLQPSPKATPQPPIDRLSTAMAATPPKAAAPLTALNELLSQAGQAAVPGMLLPQAGVFIPTGTMGTLQVYEHVWDGTKLVLKKVVVGVVSP